MNTEPIEGDYSVPIRRTRWSSFWIAIAAQVVSLILAAAFSGLLLLSSIIASGAVVIMVFGLLWWGIFFFSFPWQRRYARSLDLRRPGIRLANGILIVPVTDDFTLQFKLDEPHELRFGWFEAVVASSGGPTSRTRTVMTYATLSQGGQQVFLKAEESAREAQAAGWSKSADLTPATPVARLWASDLVALVEAIQTRPSPTVPAHQPALTTARAAPDIRDWPSNPLQARNRHEAMLYLERQKAEIISRSPIEGGEVVVGRTPEFYTDANPYLCRFVFAFLEGDPDDENDFGSGVSRILDPAELMLEVEKLERADSYINLRNISNLASLALTHKTTREIAAIRRLQARCIGLLDQLMRFAQADGWPSEESFRTKTARILYQRTRERFHIDALSARQQALRENLKVWQFPITNLSQAERQIVLLQALAGRCPDYLTELQLAGFESEQLQHPEFRHSHHLARFAARALHQGRVEQAEAAFAAWTIAQPNDLYFPTKEFATAIYELKVDSAIAVTFVPERQRNYFAGCYQEEVDPGYAPWGY